MRKNIYIAMVFIFISVSCTTHDNKGDLMRLMKVEVMGIATKYASDKFSEAKVITGNDGIVTVKDNQLSLVVPEDKALKYTLNPINITFGLINDDDQQDAIMVLSSSRGNYAEIPEILVLTSQGGKFSLNRVIESDMRILAIQDRIITAELTTKSRNSPLHDCHLCKEIIKYRFTNGDLVKAQ